MSTGEVEINDQCPTLLGPPNVGGAMWLKILGDDTKQVQQFEHFVVLNLPFMIVW